MRINPFNKDNKPLGLTPQWENWGPNILAKIVNPTIEKERTMATHLKKMRRAEMSARHQKIQRYQQPLDQAANSLSESPQTTWDELTPRQKKDLMKSDDTLDRAGLNLKEERKALGYAANQGLKEISRDMLPPVSELDEDLTEYSQKDLGNLDYGKIIDKLYVLRVISRQNTPEGRAASDLLHTERIQRLIKESGLRVSEWIPSPKKEDTNYTGNTNVDTANDSIENHAQITLDKINASALNQALENFKKEQGDKSSAPQTVHDTLEAKLTNIGIADANIRHQIVTGIERVSPATLNNLQKLLTGELDQATLHNLIQRLTSNQGSSNTQNNSINFEK